MTPVVEQYRKKALIGFQKTASIRFRSIELLNLSFIHRSATNENGLKLDNERLEFLGDAILGAIAAILLFRMMEERPEGELARVKSVVVSEASLASIALDLKIDTLLILGKGEESSGGRQKKTLLADAMEALIGAYYLDSGFSAVFDFVSRHLSKQIELVLENKHKKDYKTLLQEYCQQQFRVYPVYTLVKKTGPDHDRLFWIEVSVQGKSYGPSFGKNKKEAEQAAACLAWDELSLVNASPDSVPTP